MKQDRFQQKLEMLNPKNMKETGLYYNLVRGKYALNHITTGLKLGKAWWILWRSL